MVSERTQVVSADDLNEAYLKANPTHEPPFMPAPYTGIRAYEKDRSIIIATTSEGFRFLINRHNGRIIGTESWVK